MKVLVVEDSEEYQKILQRTLGEYRVVCVGTAEEASVQIRNSTFDLILVDINLPQRDGYSLIGEIQTKIDASETVVMCLTGRSGLTDKVTAFSLGADDYITKPFDPLELRARVEARLKKVGRRRASELRTTVGDIEIDHARHRVSVGAAGDRREVDITQTEFKILACLARRPDQVFTRDQLLVAAWGDDASVLERVVDVHICLLRKKLGASSHRIRAVTGIGYKLTPASVKKTAS